MSQPNAIELTSNTIPKARTPQTPKDKAEARRIKRRRNRLATVSTREGEERAQFIDLRSRITLVAALAETPDTVPCQHERYYEVSAATAREIDEMILADAEALGLIVYQDGRMFSTVFLDDCAEAATPVYDHTSEDDTYLEVVHDPCAAKLLADELSGLFRARSRHPRVAGTSRDPWEMPDDEPDWLDGFHVTDRP